MSTRNTSYSQIIWATGTRMPVDKCWSDYHRHDVCLSEVLRTNLLIAWVLAIVARTAIAHHGYKQHSILAECLGHRVFGPRYLGTPIITWTAIAHHGCEQHSILAEYLGHGTQVPGCSTIRFKRVGYPETRFKRVTRIPVLNKLYTRKPGSNECPVPGYPVTGTRNA